MLQTGTLYSPSNNENAVEFQKPLPNVYIYFSQNGTRKYTVKTDAKGAFSVDLALGSYQVTISQGAGFEIFPLGGGAPFELTSDSAVDAFEKWVLSPVYLKPEENPLVVLLNNLVSDARTSATKAKTEADRAEQAVGNSVGTGKIMREGAFGLGSVFSSGNLLGSEFDIETTTGLGNGFYGVAGNSTGFPAIKKSGDSLLKLGFNSSYYSMLFFSATNRAFTISRREGTLSSWAEFYTTVNTTIDSNGFIKSASPIIKLFDGRIETNGQFKEEPIFEKIGVGTYKISNTLGLAKEGWTYEIPRGKDGNPYFHIKVDKLEDGCIISVHDAFGALEEATITDIDGNERKINKVVKILGEARDIKPHERWIDLRFHEEPEEIEDIDEVVELEEEQSDLDKFLEEHNAVLL